MKAFTLLIFVITGQMGGRGYVFRGLAKRHQFRWNQDKRRHELGPFSLDDYRTLRGELMEVRHPNIRVSVDVAGEVELPEGLVPIEVAIPLPDSAQEKPREFRQGPPIPAGANPMLHPATAPVPVDEIEEQEPENPLLAGSDLVAEEVAPASEPTPELPPEVVEPVAEVSQEQAQEPTPEPQPESTPAAAPAAEVAPQIETVATEEVSVNTSQAAPTAEEVAPGTEPKPEAYTHNSLEKLNVEQLYAILTEWHVPNRSEAKGKEKKLIKLILAEQRKRAEQS
jgi:hypothetical protein